MHGACAVSLFRCFVAARTSEIYRRGFTANLHRSQLYSTQFHILRRFIFHFAFCPSQFRNLIKPTTNVALTRQYFQSIYSYEIFLFNTVTIKRIPRVCSILFPVSRWVNQHFIGQSHYRINFPFVPAEHSQKFDSSSLYAATSTVLDVANRSLATGTSTRPIQSTLVVGHVRRISRHFEQSRLFQAARHENT